MTRQFWTMRDPIVIAIRSEKEWLLMYWGNLLILLVLDRLSSLRAACYLA